MISIPDDPVALLTTVGGLRVDRRAFLALGGGAALLPLTGGAVASVPRSATQRVDIRYVITDRRFAESLQFGQVLTARGSVRLEVADGLTNLWQRALRPLWRKPGGAVAGLTSREVWICLAEQARSESRQTVLRGLHTFGVHPVAAAHSISAPRGMSGAAGMIENSGHAWPQAMAMLIRQCPSDAHMRDSEWRRGDPPQLSSQSLSLTSWVIA